MKFRYIPDSLEMCSPYKYSEIHRSENEVVSKQTRGKECVSGMNEYISCRKAVAKTSAVPSLAVYVAQDCTGDTYRLFICCFVSLSTVCCSEPLTLRCLLAFLIVHMFLSLWFCALQCTKRMWCDSVTCHSARLPLTHPAKPGSLSSYWCLCGWEERPSTRPTSNVSRSEHPAPICWPRCPPHCDAS